MAEGLLRSFDPELEVHSAGTHPARHVHPCAIRAMAEIGIDISCQTPKNVQQYLNQSFDYVITVCENANVECPAFSGIVGRRLHMGFEDPGAVIGTDSEVLDSFRKIRDQIHKRMRDFYDSGTRHSG